ncbi:MAG TPA: hypothetical protein VEH76_08780 [Methylocystis sp.]|nr:hypothetical protein [Methylocystis sp.]
MANREQHSHREAKKPKKNKSKTPTLAVSAVEGLIDKARGHVVGGKK